MFYEEDCYLSRMKNWNSPYNMDGLADAWLKDSFKQQIGRGTIETKYAKW